jgi:hypothetical protein
MMSSARFSHEADKDIIGEPCRFAVAILWALQPHYDLIFTAG